MKLYEKISVLRKKNSISQEDLANKLEISRQSVYKWEQGVSYPEIDKLKKLAQIFNVTFDDLLNDEIDIDIITEPVSEPIKTRAPKFRSVFVSSRKLNGKSHADRDNGVTKDSKAKYEKYGNDSYEDADDYFKRGKKELDALIASRKYSYVRYLQPDLLVNFFADEKRGICGFFFDGCERFVCPIENIIDITIFNDGSSMEYSDRRITGVGVGSGGVNSVMVGTIPQANLLQPKQYDLSIIYFTNQGETATYKLSLHCYRKYFAFNELASSWDEIYSIMNQVSIFTSKALSEIRDAITALRAKGELIKNDTVEFEDLDIAQYRKQEAIADRLTEKKMVELDNTVKANNKKRKWRIAIIVSVVAIVVPLCVWLFFHYACTYIKIV